MFKKFALVGLAALALAGCDDSLFSANAVEQQNEDPFARPAKIAIAAKTAFSLKKTFPGVTEASRNSVLAFRVAGQIDDLPVNAGQRLKEGELIARLDDTPYLNVVASRQATFDLARTRLTRTESLFEKKHVAKAALDEAKSNFASAEVALKIAKEDVGYTELRAPFDGEVARIDVERFQNVGAGTPVIQFHGNKNIDFVFNVPERLFLLFNPSKVVVHPTVDVIFDSQPDRKFTATYKEHDGLPDPVTRSFKVKATMAQPDDLIVLPGMSVTVTLDTAMISNLDTTEGVLVPLEAVFEEAGKRWVWKIDDKSEARKTEVDVFGIEDGGIRIKSGLEDGDQVIAVGVAHVTEGEKIRPYKKERGL